MKEQEIIFEIKIGHFYIMVEKLNKSLFNVVYGLQRQEQLSYLEASHTLGVFIMHALSCEGKLD